MSQDTPELRVILDGQAFRELLAGKEVTGLRQFPERPVVRVILLDIGWDVMRAAIDSAQQGKEDVGGPA